MTPLKDHQWLVSPAKALLILTHGMMEDQDRYAEFAAFMNTKGISVIAYDVRGHGKSCPNPQLGFLGKGVTWRTLVEDLHALRVKASQEFPSLPVFLLGHSMGSFITQSYIARYGKGLRGVVLTGTSYIPLPLSFMGLLASRILGGLLGDKRGGKWVQFLTFFNYNKGISDSKTPYDWISNRPQVVRDYLKNPYCGFSCTASFFECLYMGLFSLFSPKTIPAIPKDLPILMLGGERDPLSHFGKGLLRLVDSYKTSGHTHINHRIYPGGRHEVLNDVLRHETYTTISDWILS